MMRIMTESSAAKCVVRESSLQRDGLYGILTLVFVAALVRGVLGATTSAAGPRPAVVFGLVIAVVVLAWVRAIRGPDRLEVSVEPHPLHPGLRDTRRSPGGRQRAAVRDQASRPAGVPVAVPVGDRDDHPAALVHPDAVRTACESQGWTFVYWAPYG